MFGMNVEQAIAPWRTATEFHADPRRHALAHAVLAPNPHNMQAWLVELVGDDALRLYPDLSKLTPEIDPPARQAMIGYGAFLELLRQAASTRGYRLRIDAFPDGVGEQRLDERAIADVTFEAADDAPDPLAGTITSRRTNRDGYDRDRPVPEDVMRRIADVLPPGTLAFEWTSAADRVERIVSLAERGWEIESENEATHRESTQVTRIGAEEVNAQPDGLSLLGIGPEVLGATGVLTREKMDGDHSFARSLIVKTYNGAIDKTATFAWLISPDNSRRTQLDCGRAWVRLNQAANREGVSMQPVSQVLEEFPAMADLYRSFHKLVGVALPARVQGLFRLGYAKDSEPTPRWPVEAKLVRP